MIKKAVIPCGGRGTRFLPVTKAVPKEILPVLDKPVLSYIVEEAVASGIEEILIIVSPGKEAIVRYFSRDDELAEVLERAGRLEEAAALERIHSRARISFAWQRQPLGSADAVGLAAEFAGGQPFALCWGDDLIVGDSPAVAQLIAAYEKTGRTIIGVQEILTDDIVKYGVVAPLKREGDLIRIGGIVEKPPLDNLPSRLAALGRYIVTPDYFEELPYIEAVRGELQFTDVIARMLKNGVYASVFSGRRYDMGSRLGALKATVELSLTREDVGLEFKQYLRSLKLD